MKDADGALYVGRVAHRRLKPVRHRFSYRVFSMLADLDRLDGLAARLTCFSRNGFNLFSFHDADFGPPGTGPVAARVRAALAARGIDAQGRLLLLFYPRILGYAFNPLAVYYCHDRAGALSAVLYEVRNTFGGKHGYLIPVDGDAPVIRQAADKVFHVSPFMAMDMRYAFRLTRPGEELAVVIRQSDAEGAVLHAAFSARRRALTDRTLLQAFFAYPLMTVKVIAGIHWEALRLLAKGLRLRKGAPDPAEPVTLVREQAPTDKAA
ncbi:DUF1365 domain-containing protein [Amphiplicatus metriothermophilus]|uniref:DUF1365 domain-containing protein n=1 Tax=Amphiplicatus metriothermophilus TaxID=1519374 RepID=A0A239PWC0_9PROT|nr:DUF1365 domain-containing protein [Amphiplicatus metriothermophilus]MBB5519683.1 hypothetical protein [Amphiplicatus metriothermophilus]SNT74246.1 hypothetical protein SAMN06297382_2157 [Amphiplicatus metriothermophilus]